MKYAEGGKGEYWRETERVLVEEGWYTRQIDAEDDDDGMGLGCGLER